MNLGSYLWPKLDLAIPVLGSAALAIYENEQLDNVLPSYLILLYGMIRSSVPLMEAAYNNCLSADIAIPYRLEYANYLQKHIEEERSHGEWLLDDLQSIGYSRGYIREKIPSSYVVEVVGSQYYLINHVHPFALLGYIAVLEGYPANEKQIMTLQQKSDYPETAFRTLFKHSQIDPFHGDDLTKLTNSMDIDKGLVHMVSQNAVYTLCKCALAFRSLI